MVGRSLMAPSHAGTRLPIAVIIPAIRREIPVRKALPFHTARSFRDSNFAGGTVLHFLSKE